MDADIEFLRDDKFDYDRPSDRALGANRDIYGEKKSNEMYQWVSSYDKDWLGELVGNKINTISLGLAVWDMGNLPIANLFPRQLFAERYDDILKAYENAGTSESYKLMGDILGLQKLAVHNAAGNFALEITVSPIVNNLAVMDKAGVSHDLTVENPHGTHKALQVSHSSTTVGLDQIISILKSLAVVGVITTFKFI